MAVQKAYERLQAGAAGGGQGPQAWRVLLLLKAQCILFRRYPGGLGVPRCVGSTQVRWGLEGNGLGGCVCGAWGVWGGGDGGCALLQGRRKMVPPPRIDWPRACDGLSFAG